MRMIYADKLPAIPFERCPVGMFLSANGELCLRTEYGLEAFIVSTGEKFWGGAKTVEQLRRVMVRPVIVEPVRHGRWEWDEVDFEYTCSNCRCSFDYTSMYELFDHGFDNASFCPNCGAKMDLE